MTALLHTLPQLEEIRRDREDICQRNEQEARTSGEETWSCGVGESRSCGVMDSFSRVVTVVIELYSHCVLYVSSRIVYSCIVIVLPVSCGIV